MNYFGSSNIYVVRFIYFVRNSWLTSDLQVIYIPEIVEIDFIFSSLNLELNVLNFIHRKDKVTVAGFSKGFDVSIIHYELKGKFLVLENSF